MLFVVNETRALYASGLLNIRLLQARVVQSSCSTETQKLQCLLRLYQLEPAGQVFIQCQFKQCMVCGLYI